MLRAPIHASAATVLVRDGGTVLATFLGGP